MPSAIGWNISKSILSLTTTPSSLPRGLETIAVDLECVQLEFKTIEDKMDFEATFDVLIFKHEPLSRAERHGSDQQSLEELDKPPRPMFLQCPFHFLGCKEEFHIWRQGQWVEHSLTHFQKKSRRLGGLVRVDPPTSCRCDFCKREFSSLTGTACWQHYMNHIPQCGLGHGRVPPSFTLIEYLWVKGILTPEIYRGLKSEERLPVPPFETKLAKVPALIKFEPIASSVSETSGDEKEGSRSEMQVNRKVQRASIETSAEQEQRRQRICQKICLFMRWKREQEQRRRRICQKVILFMLWKGEQDVCLPNELWSSPASFEFISVLEVSPFDKIKGLFETYSGMEWDWWPFAPIAKPLESGKVRIRWQCVGELDSDNTTC